jgi:anthranilate synthase component 1
MQNLVCREFGRPLDLSVLADRFPDRFPYLLESSAQGPLGRCSLLLYAGEEELVKCPFSGLQGPGQGDTFFARLNSWFEELSQESSPPDDIPFIGGWFVYLGYEISAEIEPVLDLPPNNSGLPDAFARRCPAAVIIFHEPGGDRNLLVAENSELMEQIQVCCDSLKTQQPRQHLTQPPVRLNEIIEEPADIFKSSVRRILEYLVQGDVFQVNISRGWSGSFTGNVDPKAILAGLRANNPAPFSGMMKRGDLTLLSSSPERLIEIHNDRVQTRPIAGTRPRGQHTTEDDALHRELIGDAKERAEHIMLIDLERNDLGRVCIPGSIEVNELMVVESYAHVHHIVSNVKGRLRRDASPVDAIRAIFPGGTITGCPKIRCMEIIAELEMQARGFYTGAMGYLGRDGRLDLNILIRSLLLQGPEFSFRCGAGIVADSDPDRELEETQEKAHGLLLSLQSVGTGQFRDAG